MEVFLHASTEKYLNKLEKRIQTSIKDHLKKLSEDPYSKTLDIKKLKGIQKKPDIFRLRVGEYRIIYFIQEDKIWITEIMKRERGY